MTFVLKSTSLASFAIFMEHSFLLLHKKGLVLSLLMRSSTFLKMAAIIFSFIDEVLLTINSWKDFVFGLFVLTR